VEFASDPTTDRIVVAFGEGDLDDDVVVSIWDGDAFVQTAEVALQGAFGQRSIDVGWVGNTGVAFAVWRDAGQGGPFMHARFFNSWTIQGEVALTGVGPLVQAESRLVPGTSRSEMVALDAAGVLHALEVRWNGTNTLWSVGNGGFAVAQGMDMARPTRSFSFDLRP